MDLENPCLLEEHALHMVGFHEFCISRLICGMAIGIVNVRFLGCFETAGHLHDPGAYNGSETTVSTGS